ncbi:unnamed protein product, partial [Staurois parvus]
MKVRVFLLGSSGSDQIFGTQSTHPQNMNFKATVHCEDSEAWLARGDHDMGSFSYYGVGPIYRIPGIMDQFGMTSEYLKRVMLPYTAIIL